MQRKIILFELNEVPFRVLDQFAKWCPSSRLAALLPVCSTYQTKTQEISPLSPWITWPSVHRGVNDERHMIQNFGQDLKDVDAEFPPIWELLRRSGVRVGVCGSLHTYPPPDSFDNYDFFIPDTFAAGAECFPQSIELFQEFNLRMARESARNVARGVPWAKALQVLLHSPELGFKLQTMTSVAGQLLSERAQKWRTVRRRTYQSILAFDIFEKQLRRNEPSFATFFTNHVASSMHRFWAASFPDDYPEMNYPPEWIRTYRAEIDWTMRVTDGMFSRLARFVDQHPEYQLWVATSMGQAATQADPIETQLYLVDLDKFMTKLGFTSGQWSRRPAMLPQTNLLLQPGLVESFVERLTTVTIDDAPVQFRQRDSGFFSIDMGQRNLDADRCKVRFGPDTGSLSEWGLENTEIEDKSGTSAYHIPEGCLFIYDPRDQSAKPARPEVSTLEIAPALLRNFRVEVPRYMARPGSLAASA
jgi:hypothetical protein